MVHCEVGNLWRFFHYQKPVSVVYFAALGGFWGSWDQAYVKKPGHQSLGYLGSLSAQYLPAERFRKTVAERVRQTVVLSCPVKVHKQDKDQCNELASQGLRFMPLVLMWDPMRQSDVEWDTVIQSEVEELDVDSCRFTEFQIPTCRCLDLWILIAFFVRGGACPSNQLKAHLTRAWKRWMAWIAWMA